MRVLVVVAHGDDETIGAGGALARHVRHEDEVSVLIMTDSDSSRHPNVEAATSRREAIAEAMGVLGVADVMVHTLKDNALDTVPKLRLSRLVEEQVRRCRPNVVYTHSPTDLSNDHRVVGEAAAVACRAGPGMPAALYAMEIRSATDAGEAVGYGGFRPSYWVELAEADLERKLEALRCYENELRPWPHARSLRAVSVLAEYRGSQIGVAAAEAFQVLRIVNPLGEVS